MTTLAKPLLSIDAASEIRKLAEGTLDGPWQVPAELVRHALTRGAGRVEVEVGQRLVVVQDDGAPLPFSLVDALARLLDVTTAAANRHGPLLEIEARATPLLSLLALAPWQLLIETRGPQGGRRLSVRRGRRPEVLTLPAGQGVRVELRGCRLDPARVGHWLRAVGRFVPVPLHLDGQLLASGFGATLGEAPLAAPLSGRLALPRSAEGGRVFLLLDGVVSAHLVLPQAPAFSAAVEMRPLYGGDGSPAALREIIRPHLPSLVEQATRLVLLAIGRLPRLGVDDRHQLQQLLLTAAERGVCRRELLRAPAWPVLRRASGESETWLTLHALGATAGPDRTLWTLAPEQAPASFLLPDEPILLVNGDVRGRLAGLLGLAFRTPQPRPRAGWGLARLRSPAATLWRRLSAAARRLTAAVPEATLSSEERTLARTLRAHLTLGDSPTEVVFCRGRGPARRSSGGRLLLSRGNPTVALAVRAVATDPRFAYPALLAMLADKPGPDGGLRRLWRALPAPPSAWV